MIVTKLKGGSLSGTYLFQPERGTPFIRKQASRVENREFGYYRLYSQLKRLQRYNALFPRMFPEVLTYGFTDGMAYFDLEYIPNSITLHEYLQAITDTKKITDVFNNLISQMRSLHTSWIMPSSLDPMKLYVEEEMLARLNVCGTSKKFNTFYDAGSGYIKFNDKKILGLMLTFNDLRWDILKSYDAVAPTECFSHGNLTLENILYQPASNRIVFIDVYDENIIDSHYADYSQICQSCHSLYEIYNSITPYIAGNSVTATAVPKPGLVFFNKLFEDFLKQQPENLRLIHLLEISQYLRMLPFKKEIDEDKMILFYSLASYLYNEMRYEN